MEATLRLPLSSSVPVPRKHLLLRPPPSAVRCRHRPGTRATTRLHAWSAGEPSSKKDFAFLSRRALRSPSTSLSPLPSPSPLQHAAPSKLPEGLRVRGPSPPGAVGSETYWITVFQAIAVVTGLAASGVVTGLLLRYKCWREAEAEVASLLAEGKTREEIIAMAAVELREQGVDLSGGAAQGEAGEKKLSDLTVPTGASATAPTPLAGAAVGRRKRPKQADE